MANEGHNLTQLKADIKATYDKVLEYQNDRESCNADILAEREALAEKGIPKEAFDAVMRYLKWDEDKRRGFDTAYTIVRDALGAPVQADLFDEIKPPEPKKRGRPPKDKAEGAFFGAMVQ